MTRREFYIDRLRSVMTALVILHHTAITYGATGGWFYYERKPSADPSSLLLTIFCATNQAYFMGFFFLLAGYFTPASLERKGCRSFLLDRFKRLGLPLLAFIVVLGPLTAAIVTAAQGRGFWHTFEWLWVHHRIINGPLWFAQALLMFSLAYCAWRALFGLPLQAATQMPKPIPPRPSWLLSACCVALGALAIRAFVPVGENIFGLQLGYFSSYIFLFALGITAWRYDWLRQLSWQRARGWILALPWLWALMPAAIMVSRMHRSSSSGNFSGGLSWQAILYALWEPLIAWGLIAAWILLFRSRMNEPSALWNWLDRRAYAVYIIHPPVLVACSLAFHGWAAPALVKFVVTGSVTIAACWLLADPLVRLPVLRRVV